MDLSGLSRLGKVGGVPGIALGVVALVLTAVLNQTGALPEPWRGPVNALCIAGVVLFGLILAIGWARGQRPRAQIAKARGDNSPASNTDKAKTGAAQHATTTGANSSAVSIRG
jgi:hypothetical protein